MIPARRLFGLLIVCDVVVVAAFVPLERYSWIVAENPSSTYGILLALLAANVTLLGIVCAAMVISAVLTRRAVARLRRPRVITGTIDEAELKQSV